MSETGSASIADDGTRIVAKGDWTLEHITLLDRLRTSLQRQVRAQARVDGHGLGRVDTAGASLLLELVGDDVSRIDVASEALRKLFAAVARAENAPPAKRRRKDSGFLSAIANVGAAAEAVWRDSVALVGFIGLILSAFARTFPIPRRWRITSTVAHIEQTGLNALPIVALLCFLVGAVVAFLGATVLKDFGASIFTVELVGYSFLREFGVLLTAIMVAGRSGSAFTAQIGSMKAREEIDAIRTLGLEPVDVLVMPRVLALIVSLPILTLVGMLAGIVGGAAVCVMTLDVSPLMFITRLHETTTVRHFWVGMSKAPIFAFLIAAIGCLEGFKVAGSAESVGSHTTSSVVQSIFVVILIDALAAIFFMEINL
ncbi:ABC transporter permease [Dokdonella immobilis]|uniref:Phospholipid/cholesterol/gamma-HCH transport system permease protein n=1 Tax=Dokdonella immobilis TaxID=578942 RepID=A0A1I4YV94_9GAMM|nr:ABC transporter permease [Dokdonella immobilis]SFN41948.1 phospholipid/cholesterol/gamma-HCH transport system permease protein [Dokdonella immobilis]